MSRERSPMPRRGFLSGLAALPLIGGGVSLIGNPTGVAAKPSVSQSYAYLEWLDVERRLLGRELFPELGRDADRFTPCNTGAHVFHFPLRSDWREMPAPSTRAALVLAAVGCDWRKSALLPD